ncbi:C2C4C protein, partial [Polypterus senegalus]
MPSLPFCTGRSLCLNPNPQLTQHCPESDKRKCRAIHNMVMTPDRIPQFIIPPLGVPISKTPRKSSSCSDYDSNPPTRIRSPSKRRHSFTSVNGTLHVSSRDKENMFKLSLEDFSDPVTRAAMSLPHLTKITTPYGFRTLGESPCIRRKESLFFDDEIRRRASFVGNRFCSSSSSSNAVASRGGHYTHRGTPSGHLMPRSPSSPVVDLRDWTTTINNRSLSCDRLSPAKEHQGDRGPTNCKLRSLLKKHLSGIGKLRSGPVLLWRTREGHPGDSGVYVLQK